jgi:hypothetical protein
VLLMVAPLRGVVADVEDGGLALGRASGRMGQADEHADTSTEVA